MQTRKCVDMVVGACVSFLLIAEIVSSYGS